MYRNMKHIYKRSRRWWHICSYLPGCLAQVLLSRIPLYDDHDLSTPVQNLNWQPMDMREVCKWTCRQPMQPQLPTPSGPCKWGLLVPICSRSSSEEDCFKKLTQFRDSLQRTCSETQHLMVHLGIDHGDTVYDTPKAKERLRGMFGDVGLPVEFHMFTAGYRGRLCWIWDRMAQAAVNKHAADFFVLFGDDIELRTEGWKQEIEQQFVAISKRYNLPFGIACVAFRDEAFPVFPTFPVLHRLHLEIFKRLFPKEFINQHGDPYLFEIYRRWGASEFAVTAALCNTVGGADDARYSKCGTGLPWRDSLLTTAIETLSAWLQVKLGTEHGRARFTCIDIVCPTYRCDVSRLKNISMLCASPEYKVSTQILFVVDKPDSSNLAQVKALEQWTANKHVRVYVNPQNLGASEARNAGHAQSFGDYVVFIDDDVVPEATLLDAYFGAVKRHPKARFWVGATKLPAPQTLMQHALAACRMTFFYDVAERMPNPPWGVTANLCVRGRTQNDVWFSNIFPKTGGGEDIDYCLRQKPSSTDRDSAVVAVPGAVVHHPFWTNILKQVAGWAAGDVKCLETLPHIIPSTQSQTGLRQFCVWHCCRHSTIPFFALGLWLKGSFAS
ncbi:unnamed protein product [Polarella glacialis]|uniref:Glycosyltransferase 2-like domain-containing protein n=1 Tax=Polarella glacialis TaxID=89957 RepID=A0A813JGE0_POLGL|nr:unnamed protein product [Polarella glacialis]